MLADSRVKPVHGFYERKVLVIDVAAEQHRVFIERLEMATPLSQRYSYQNQDVILPERLAHLSGLQYYFFGHGESTLGLTSHPSKIGEITVDTDVPLQLKPSNAS